MFSPEKSVFAFSVGSLHSFTQQLTWGSSKTTAGKHRKCNKRRISQKLKEIVGDNNNHVCECEAFFYSEIRSRRRNSYLTPENRSARTAKNQSAISSKMTLSFVRMQARFFIVFQRWKLMMIWPQSIHLQWRIRFYFHCSFFISCSKSLSNIFPHIFLCVLITFLYVLQRVLAPEIWSALSLTYSYHHPSVQCSSFAYKRQKKNKNW